MSANVVVLSAVRFAVGSCRRRRVRRRIGARDQHRAGASRAARLPDGPALHRSRHRHVHLRPDARRFCWNGSVPDRGGSSGACWRRSALVLNLVLPLARAAPDSEFGKCAQWRMSADPADAGLSRRLLLLWRGLDRLHDLHDRLRARCRRRRAPAERILHHHRARRIRFAVAVGRRDQREPRRRRDGHRHGGDGLRRADPVLSQLGR